MLSGRFLTCSATILISFLLTGGAAAQCTWYVDDDAIDDPGPGDVSISDPLEDGSATHPFDAIQEAIDVAVAGDEIIVADGVYAGEGNKGLNYGGKDLVVRSLNGAAACTIDCEYELRAFSFTSGETANAVVDGFTIIHGDRSASTGDGAGIACYNYSNPTIRNCVVRSCNAGRYGGGVFAYLSAPTLINCLLVSNAANSGGGAAARSSEIRLVNCTIAENVADDSGGGVLILKSSDATIENSIIADNTAPNGTDLSLGGVDYASVLTISYSAVPGGEAAVQITGDSTLNWGSGMVGNDPEFADPSAEDFHLATGSPCVDAGTNTPTSSLLPFADLAGNWRVVDGDGDIEPWSGSAATVDMGPYELREGEAPLLCVSPLTLVFTGRSEGDDPNCQILSIANCGADVMSWEITEDCDWLAVDSAAGESAGEINEILVRANPDGLAAGSYACTLTVVAPDTPNSPWPVDVYLRVGGTLHVPGDYGTIQAAIDAAQDGDEVLVADGTYTGTGNHSISMQGKDIVLRSENGPAYCVIDCDEANRAFHLYSSEPLSARIEGFTITNGFADYGGGVYVQPGSSITLRNCVLSSCWSFMGGGAIRCLNGRMRLQHCTFTNNGALLDATAIYSRECDLTLSNCLLYENQSVESYEASVVYVPESSATLSNCTIVDNGTVGLWASANATVSATNSVFAFNTTPQDRQVWVRYASTFSTSYGDVLGGSDAVYVDTTSTLNWGVGMINEDPLFIESMNDDYRLSPFSPCVDAGTNNPPTGLPPLDLAGAARIIDGDGDIEPWSGQAATVDMGAYEFGATIAGDFDGDDDLDTDDFAVFLAAYGSCVGDTEYLGLADLDDDGCVTALDYQSWLGLYREFVDDPFAPPPSGLPGDCDRDGVVNLADLQILLAGYGTVAGETGFNAAADFDDDGDIDLVDLQTLLAAYGTGVS